MDRMSKSLNINNRPVSTRVVIGSYGLDRGGRGVGPLAPQNYPHSSSPRKIL